MGIFSKHSYSTIASVALHVALVGALTLSFKFARTPSAAPRASVIEAVLVDEGAIEREMARLEAESQAEIHRREQEEREAREAAEAARVEREREEERLQALQREREAAERAERERTETLRLERQREAAEQREREAAAEAERQRLAELQRQREEEERQRAEAERRRLEEERRRQEEEARLAAERAAEEERQRREAAELARKQAELESELERALAAEEEARRARDTGLLDEYIRSIESQIEQRWIRPASAAAGLECIVNVTQIPSGDVTSVTVGRCNGDEAVIRSIEAAVLRASPLPRPPVPSLFNRNLEIVFRPDN